MSPYKEEIQVHNHQSNNNYVYTFNNDNNHIISLVGFEKHVELMK